MTIFTFLMYARGHGAETTMLRRITVCVFNCLTSFEGYAIDAAIELQHFQQFSEIMNSSHTALPSLAGAFPYEWLELANLNLLDVSNCSLTGPLPALLETDPEWPSLTYLNLSANNFTGEAPCCFHGHGFIGSMAMASLHLKRS